MRDESERYWRQLVAMADTMPHDVIGHAAELLLACHRSGGTVFPVGNGGSAATASHFACDLAKGTRTASAPPFRVVPLADNVPLLTAWANDVDYACVFAEQLAALVRPHDVVVAISASGNSPNVLAVVQVARRVGARTIALTGRHGGQLRSLADVSIQVPADMIEQVEDAHLAIAHSLCVMLRARLAAQPLTAGR